MPCLTLSDIDALLVCVFGGGLFLGWSCTYLCFVLSRRPKGYDLFDTSAKSTESLGELPPKSAV